VKNRYKLTCFVVAKVFIPAVHKTRDTCTLIKLHRLIVYRMWKNQIWSLFSYSGTRWVYRYVLFWVRQLCMRQWIQNFSFLTYCHNLGVWIGYWIYWPLVHTTRNYTLQNTDTHRLVSSVTVSTSCFLATDLTRWRFFSFPHSGPCHSCLCRTLCQLTTKLTGSQAGGRFTSTF
jgi:hypothetical protein